jgi:hypothetical protein
MQILDVVVDTEPTYPELDAHTAAAIFTDVLYLGFSAENPAFNHRC